MTLVGKQQQYKNRQRAKGYSFWNVEIRKLQVTAGDALTAKHPELFSTKSELVHKALTHLCRSFGIDGEGKGMLSTPDASKLDQSTRKETANGS